MGKNFIGLPSKRRFKVYTRWCHKCHNYFETESKSRGKRTCPNCHMNNPKSSWSKYYKDEHLKKQQSLNNKKGNK